MGTNPVVVKSGDQRRKLSPGEQVSITSGDIIELIPGHHFFKYVASSLSNSCSNSSSPNTPKRGCNDGREIVKSDQPCRKKMRGAPEDKAKAVNKV